MNINYLIYVRLPFFWLLLWGSFTYYDCMVYESR